MTRDFNIGDKLNEQINRVDEEILFLLKRRFQTLKKLIKLKNESGEKVFENNMENDLIISKIAKARTMQLEENFIRELFELIIEESKRIEKECNIKK